MIRILLISDSHGISEKELKKIIQSNNADYACHLGDHLLDQTIMESLFTKYVNGNCDLVSSHKQIDWKIIDPTSNQKYNFTLLHGDRPGCYDTNQLIDNLVNLAKTKGNQFILFGHTHIPFFKKIDDVYLINPGSLQMNRLSDVKQSFAILTINNQDVNVDFFKYEPNNL
ncbi:MAG: YfcE family phosphodiesterase [Mycoplasmataceae bacterium]|nr:YfcE family phosphodiesterase [Mycoplasmataceae bacterium]